MFSYNLFCQIFLKQIFVTRKIFSTTDQNTRGLRSIIALLNFRKFLSDFSKAIEAPGLDQ